MRPESEGACQTHDGPVRNQTYTYVWKTDKTWSKAPAGPCRQLQLKFSGGSQEGGKFRFT